MKLEILRLVWSVQTPCPFISGVGEPVCRYFGKMNSVALYYLDFVNASFCVRLPNNVRLFQFRSDDGQIS